MKLEIAFYHTCGANPNYDTAENLYREIILELERERRSSWPTDEPESRGADGAADRNLPDLAAAEEVAALRQVEAEEGMKRWVQATRLLVKVLSEQAQLCNTRSLDEHGNVKKEGGLARLEEAVELFCQTQSVYDESAYRPHRNSAHAYTLKDVWQDAEAAKSRLASFKAAREAAAIIGQQATLQGKNGGGGKAVGGGEEAGGGSSALDLLKNYEVDDASPTVVNAGDNSARRQLRIKRMATVRLAASEEEDAEDDGEAVSRGNVNMREDEAEGADGRDTKRGTGMQLGRARSKGDGKEAASGGGGGAAGDSLERQTKAQADEGVAQGLLALSRALSSRPKASPPPRHAALPPARVPQVGGFVAAPNDPASTWHKVAANEAVRALLDANDAISKPSFNGNGNGLVEGTPEEGERREEEKKEERNEGQEAGDEYCTTDTSRQLQEDCDGEEEGERGQVSSGVSREVSGVECVAQGAGGRRGETQDKLMMEKERNVRGELIGETGSIGRCVVDGEEGEMGESGGGGSRSEGEGRKDQKGTQERDGGGGGGAGGGGRDNAGGSRGAGEEGGVGGGRGSAQDGDEDGREGRKVQDTKAKETEVQRKEDERKKEEEEKEKKRKEDEEERKTIAEEHERALAKRLIAEAQREEAKRDQEFKEFNDNRIREIIKGYDEVL